ncbi:FtsX-like permease family protein [Alteromonas sediminis]|uniref:FtsX-like permease family protein n=1 Tax=Alteromonas sediminis TaxID=2259342 RepID=A0A3N5Y0B9_9ALTE|nr:FtsX-like permease family protein [Alteromonas sediminis]RPJ65906.1 FtsX-like permease family protein [Alteromonas sediminis]
MFEIKPIFNALCRSKVGAILLLLQIAITTAVVSNASFIIYDHVQYLNKETGFPQDELFRFTVLTFGKDRELSQQFELDEAMLRNIPGVINAVTTNAVPLSGSGSSSSFRLKPSPEESESVNAAYYFADEHALETFGVKLIEGRNFLPEDVRITNTIENAPNVAIVSKAFAEAMFPDEPALGKNFYYFGDKPLKIIGIVDTMLSPWPRSSRPPENTILVPMINPGMYQHIMVRTQAGERAAIMRQMEDVMLDAYNKRVIINIEALDQVKQDYDASDVLMMRMLIVIILVLVSVTALGIFGLTQFNISKRTKQIGTRRALGARKSDIIRYFLVENAMVCLGGLFIGSISAVLLGTQLMQWYSIPALDNSYVAVTALAVFAMTMLAVVVPAKRAANISPSIATRTV